MGHEFKYGLKYLLEVETNEKPSKIISIELPFTVEFNCRRNDLASVSTGTFKIFNLSVKTATKIFKDKYKTNIFRGIVFKITYSDLSLNNNSIIFKGNVREAYTERQGVNLITTIHAWDGGDAIANAVSHRTIGKGQSISAIIRELASDLTNISNTYIGEFSLPLKRDVPIYRGTWDYLRELTNDNIFIDNQQLFALGFQEFIITNLKEINVSTGLLSSPRRNNNQLVFKMLLEPQIVVGQKLDIVSTVEPILNGPYKVIGLMHSGTVSGAVSAKTVTQVNLNFGIDFADKNIVKADPNGK